MKVLVATQETQGQRKNDFAWVPDGELVRVSGSECDGEGVDGKCGCRRSFVGTKTQVATTTAKVADVELDGPALNRIVRAGLRAGGWLKLCSKAEADEWVQQETDEILRVASFFPPGTVVERRGTSVNRREALDT